MLMHFSAASLTRGILSPLYHLPLLHNGDFAVWRRCSPDGEPTTGAALWIPASFKKLD